MAKGEKEDRETKGHHAACFVEKTMAGGCNVQNKEQKRRRCGRQHMAYSQHPPGMEGVEKRCMVTEVLREERDTTGSGKA